MKKIRKSNRGLTFTADDPSLIGAKFRYIIDRKASEILIIEDENGAGTVSRKRSGKAYKPLFDIRSKEVRDIVSGADYLEVEVLEDRIVVHVYRKAGISEKALKKDIIRIEDVLCVKTGEIVLAKAAGCENAVYAEETPGAVQSILTTLPEEFRERERTNFHKVYDVVSLFSGAGLLDNAFKDHRIRFVYGIDYDRDAVETYRFNIGNHIECRDIRSLSAEEVPSADIVLGGACCQSYSNANRHNIESETGKQKRLLVQDFIRITSTKKPKVFVLENVPQILSREEGFYLNLILEGLSGYEITCKVVSDEEVGGYTMRKRAIIIGSRIGRIELPDVKLITPKTVRDALSKVDSEWFNYNDITASSPETMLKMSFVPQGGNYRDVPEHICKWGPSTQSNTYRRLKWDEPSPTIVNWRKCCMMPPVGNRILSVAEAAALMGLNKDFRVLGASISARQQQIGNGVTQAIGRFVKRYVLNALDAFSLKAEGVPA